MAEYPPPPSRELSACATWCLLPSPRWVLPTDAYTPWFSCALALLIDWTPIWLAFVVPMIGLLITDGVECVPLDPLPPQPPPQW